MTELQRRLDYLRAMRREIDDQITVLEAGPYIPMRRSKFVTPPCGTESSYQRHRHRGETCAECKAAHAAHERVASARRRLEAS